MRWLAKALLQKSLSGLPRSERANYVLQRHVSRTLPGSERRLRTKFARAAQHLAAYERFGPDRPVGDALFYELGAGWDLAVPLSLWALGVERQLLVDVRPNVRLPLVNVTIERLDGLANALETKAGRRLRAPGRGLNSLGELEGRFGITYLAPRDARRTGLDPGSIDVVSSTSTLEHIPEQDLVPLLTESRRLLKPDGILSAVIDLSDHYARFDDSISSYNFLRFSGRTWSLVNSSLHHQNRLRRPDYLAACQEAGLEVAWERAWSPRGDALEALRNLEPAERFRTYSFDDLAVQTLRLVARPHQTLS
jgi:SAM-dependent methyltransferase